MSDTTQVSPDSDDEDEIYATDWLEDWRNTTPRPNLGQAASAYLRRYDEGGQKNAIVFKHNFDDRLIQIINTLLCMMSTEKSDSYINRDAECEPIILYGYPFDTISDDFDDLRSNIEHCFNQISHEIGWTNGNVINQRLTCFSSSPTAPYSFSGIKVEVFVYKNDLPDPEYYHSHQGWFSGTLIAETRLGCDDITCVSIKQSECE